MPSHSSLQLCRTDNASCSSNLERTQEQGLMKRGPKENLQSLIHFSSVLYACAQQDVSMSIKQ